MCGIIGYKGEKRASEFLFKGLRNLEYRGYDSVGMATIFNDNIELRKEAGNLDEVNSKLNFLEMNGNIGIAHTRWSTHGKPSAENAHPFLSSNSEIGVAHNGIIENYKELREKLEREGFSFSSDTDSEVIPFLIEKYSEKYDFEEAVKKALGDLEGSFSLVIINKFYNKIIGVRKFSPLIIGIGECEFFLASDFSAFSEYTKKVMFIEDNEMVIIDDKIKIVNLINNLEVNREIDYIDNEFIHSDKGNFEHFMLKEIHEQPESIKNPISNFLNYINYINSLKNIKRIIIIACGSSYYAGLVGKFFIESMTRIPVELDYASEFRYRNPIIDKNDLVIAISQSGETADTIGAALEAKGKNAKLYSICNVYGSSLTRISDLVMYTKAGIEIGVATTKSFVNQLVILFLFSLYFSKSLNKLSDKELNEKLEFVRKLSFQIEKILNDKSILKIVEDNYIYNNFIFLGRGVNYPIALEGALKLKEVAYIHAEGCPAAEMKHGNIALIDEKIPVIVIAIENETYYKTISNIEEIKARGGKVIVIASEGDEKIKNISDEVIYVPKTDHLLYPFLTIIPLQLIAYYIARKRNCNIDKPRNLAKSVSVE
ncbi:MAG: glutamine--fructose-6-phosphate transaminase (isomerizing) [Nanoarchaeota archaeon]